MHRHCGAARVGHCSNSSVFNTVLVTIIQSHENRENHVWALAIYLEMHDQLFHFELLKKFTKFYNTYIRSPVAAPAMQ